MDNGSTFGKRLRDARLRDARGNVTQATVAEACSVEPATISMWENDKSTPTYANLLALSGYLRVRIDWLMRGLPPTRVADTVDTDTLAMILKEVFDHLANEGRELLPEELARVVANYYTEKTLPETDRRTYLRGLIAMAQSQPRQQRQSTATICARS